MLSGCLQDFSSMFSGCSDGSYWPGGIWWSFQMKVWTLKIQRNPMIPNYSMIPAAAIRWSPATWWSIRSMDFDNRKVYGDTSITDGLVLVMIIMLTCESVNRDIMADLFSGSFNNLQLSMMEYLVKKKRSLCQKRFRPFHQSVTRVWEVLNKVILGGWETTKGIFCTRGWETTKVISIFFWKDKLFGRQHLIQ